MIVTIFGIVVVVSMLVMLAMVIREEWQEAKERRAFFERGPSMHEYMERWRKDFEERNDHRC